MLTGLAVAAVLSASALAQSYAVPQYAGAANLDTPAAMISGGVGIQYFSGSEVAGEVPQVPQPVSAATSQDSAEGATGGSSGGSNGSYGSGRLVPLQSLSGIQAASQQTTSTGKATGGSLIGSTFEWVRNQGSAAPGLTTAERWSACGLIAAEALARFLSNNPDLNKVGEIRNVAVAHGLWDQNVGMHGSVAEQKMLAYIGIQVDVVWINSLSSAEQKMIATLQAGKPVIIGTPRHYFFAEGYSNGKFFVGHTGEVMKGFLSSAGAQMTVSQISQAGNGIVTLLIAK
ncbi:MAG: hypothetical protein NTX64_13910 [Elusimicrobia bacterium]|nr:hypothetical protein [Elusimicrobiota bacterium]